MLSAFFVLVYIVIFVGALFLADAIVGLVRKAGGADDEAVDRRLQQAAAYGAGSWGSQDLMRRQADRSVLIRVVPFSRPLGALIRQSGMKIGFDAVLMIMGAIFVFVSVGLLYVMPIELAWLSLAIAAVLAVFPVISFFVRARSKRRRLFDEQLPDAIDLIVRSLKIGHPFSGAMQVIARDMPPPISDEFAIACEQINYGRDIPSAIMEMTTRVGASDLGYVATAVQIQQETGGNLVESLSKLGAVVRDRFRMFRKVKAITAEGRFSAWALSLFPLLIAGMITLVKHDYFTQVMDFKYFSYLVALIIVMLVVNVIMMRILTTLKV